MDDTIRAILAAVMRREGGAVNHPADRGGATYRGVTLARARDVWPGITFEQLCKKTDDELIQFYYAQYVKGPGFDIITDHRLLELVVDFAINSGPEDAIQAIQVAVGVDDTSNRQVDILGPRTRAALAVSDPVAVYRSVFLFRWKKLDDVALRNRVVLEFLQACQDRPDALAGVLRVPVESIRKCQLAFASGWNGRLRELCP